MNFDSRETYLVAVANWKANYAQLSHDLRTAKSEFKVANSKMSKAQCLAQQRDEATMTPFVASLRTVNQLRGHIDHLKGLARDALDERAKSKVEAQEQWYADRANNSTC